MIKLFGFTLGKKDTVQRQPESDPALVLPQTAVEDGAVTITQGAYYGTYVDLEGSVRNELELISRYREMSLHPECSMAIDDIVTESISQDADNQIIKINLEQLKQPESIKKKIETEFEEILHLLNFKSLAEELFRRWYIDGRLFFHVMVNEDNPKLGIQELRFIDPRKIRKVREILKHRDPHTGTEQISATSEYYAFNDRGMTAATYTASVNQGTRIATDSIIYVPSGMLDAKSVMVISHLHKAIKPLNQLRMIEDAVVIYRLSRAPERRIFYIDVGNLPKLKAEQYVHDIMVKYRNKLVYDASTGEIRDERKHLSMLEDFWLPRREGCLSLDTKVKLLDGRDVELGQLIVEFKSGKTNWTYSVSPNGTIVPGKISWAGVTRTDTEVIDIHLDNGEVITATPDHKFILRNGIQIEAQDLQEGSSLMPLYMRDAFVTHNRNGMYPQIQDNQTGKWEFVHRMVAKNILGDKKTNEVVHHKDFTRVNNTPENLVYMDKREHFDYHSHCGTNSWQNGDRKIHIQRLSESGKAFFLTEDGLKRKKEISEFNQDCKEVWQGLETGRAKIKQLRTTDKVTMSHREYLKKWSPGLESASPLGVEAARQKILLDRSELTKEQFREKYSRGNKTGYTNKTKHIRLSDIEREIHNLLSLDINTSNTEIVSKIVTRYPSLNLKKLRLFLSHQGYTSISDFIARRLGTSYVSKKRAVQVEMIPNHQVTKIVRRTDKIDVGTLTIDEHHEYHDYHNFALSSGIFVMNSKGTEITTLPPGQNLGQLEDVIYFRKKLYQSLNVPMTRLDESAGGGLAGLGRAAEISRDEIKFFKFIQRLRRKFAQVFDDALRIQLSLKGICSTDEWSSLKQDITYDFMSDNHYYELRDAELTTNRITLAAQVEPFVGKYYSQEWVKRHILRMTEEEIETMQKELDAEPAPTPMEGGGPMPDQPQSAPPNEPEPSAPASESLTPDLDAATQQTMKKYK